MKLFGWIAAAVLFCLAGAPARAQSLYGPGGLFLHPSASVPPWGQATPSVLVLPQHNSVANSTRTWISGSVNYGLLPDVEITGTYLKVAGWGRSASLGGSAKWRIQREGLIQPAIAVGGTYLGGGGVDTRTLFVAAQKGFGAGGLGRLKLHLGLQYADLLDGDDRSGLQPFAGVELGLASRLTFIAEARPRGKNELGTPLALTLSYRAAENWNLALTWANNGMSDEPMFGFGAGFSLGTRR